MKVAAYMWIDKTSGATTTVREKWNGLGLDKEEIT